MRKLVLCSLAAFLVTASARPMFADGTGSSVSATLTFGDTSQTVYYNAFTNGDSYVYQADPITIPGTFTYVDGANTDTATFTGSTLTITDTSYFNASPFLMTFTDPVITGYTLISDTFPSISSFSGGVFYFNSPGTENPGVQTAVFDYTAGPVSATPEPSSLVLLGSGVLSLAGAIRRRVRA
jgi:hypothetical protein